MTEEPTGGAERRVAGEGDFFGGEKDSNLDTEFMFDFGGAREDEGGFAEICLSGEGLHFIGGETASVGEDGEGVAFEGVFGEDVDLA